MSGPRTDTRTNQVHRQSRLSRLVALVLRHRPEEVGLSLDASGFVAIDALASALATQPGWEALTVDDLAALAQADGRRYEVRDGRIRARYGHTVTIEPGEPALPPEWLYHGCAQATASGMRVPGLKPQDRQHVHLSTTPRAALEVGRRHASDAVVVVVFARRAEAAGVAFWRAGTALYLTLGVPSEFLLFPGDSEQDDQTLT
jgi:putative RNA 2'-phosphotransferase